MVDETPTFYGKKIRLECIPCRIFCEKCPNDYLLIKSDKNKCIYGSVCPNTDTEKYALKTENGITFCEKIN